MNNKQMMKNHMGKISRLVGNDVSSKFSYIISGDDIVSAYSKMKDELGYPLMMDSKYRRAIVYNKKGLERQIQNVINNSILENIQLLDTFVAQDVTNKINNAIGNKTNSSSNLGSMIGSVLGKGIVNGISSIVDDMLYSNDK